MLRASPWLCLMGLLTACAGQVKIDDGGDSGDSGGGDSGSGDSGDSGAGDSGSGDSGDSGTGDSGAGDSGDSGDSGSSATPLSAVAAGELVVTEIMNNPSAVDDTWGEWFEVHNLAGDAVDLNGLIVTDADGVTFTVAGSVVVDPGGYAVLAREEEIEVNGGVEADYDYRSDLVLGNSRGSLTLSYGSVTFDVVAWSPEELWPDDGGASMALDPGRTDATSNDNGQLWCEGTSTYGDGDLGTPGAANDGCTGLTDGDGDGFVEAHDCDDGASSVYPGATERPRDGTDSDCDGADTLAADLRVGDLVINEIMKNPDAVSDGDGEWFEVYNNSGSTVNLRDLGVGDDLGVSFTVGDDVVAAVGAYLVFAVDGDPANNGGVTAVTYDYPGSAFGLANTDDVILLSVGGTTIDRVAYDNGVNFPDPVGGSFGLDSSQRTSTGNDSGSAWCDAISRIGGDPLADFGTPGAANDRCR